MATSLVIRSSCDPCLDNPSNFHMIRRILRRSKCTPWKIPEKEAVDEIILKEPNTRVQSHSSPFKH